MDRCNSNVCLNGGTCIITVIDDIPTPKCECLINFGGPNCNLDLCSSIECGSGTCIGGTCDCDEGYFNDGNVCMDMCEGINCGTGGNCLNGICSCQPGYATVGNICEETCALSPCQEMIQNLVRAVPIKMRFDPVSQDK